MKNLYFDDFEDLVCTVADTYDSLKGEDYEDVAIIAKYEEARQIIKELLCIGYDIHSINIIDEEYGEYDAEYIISIYDDEIWCEQMLRENGYITDDSPVMYILDNCSSKVIPYCKGKKVYEVGIRSDDEKDYEINGVRTTKKVFDKYVNTYINPKNDSGEESDDEDDEDPCEECCNDCNCFCDEDENGNVHGFTVSKTDENGYVSCSYYSSEGFDEDDMRDILELLGYRFKD